MDACLKGKIPKLTPENRRFKAVVLDRVLPGLPNGFGGFQYAAIDSVLNRFNFPPGTAQVLYDRCIVAIKAIQHVRSQEKEDA